MHVSSAHSCIDRCEVKRGLVVRITDTGDAGVRQTGDQRTRLAQGPLLGVCVDKKCESVVRRKTSGQQRLQRKTNQIT